MTSWTPGRRSIHWAMGNSWRARPYTRFIFDVSCELLGGLYQNKVNFSLTFNWRQWYLVHNCKIVYCSIFIKILHCMGTTNAHNLPFHTLPRSTCTQIRGGSFQCLTPHPFTQWNPALQQPQYNGHLLIMDTLFGCLAKRSLLHFLVKNPR